jgi:hypothetical protein
MSKVKLVNKNVRFFDQPERIFKMDYIFIYPNGDVDMGGTTPDGFDVDNVFCELGDFQAWDYDDVDPLLKVT